VEEERPLFEGFVGGEEDGAAFVTGADDLEEEIGTALIDGEVTDFEHRSIGCQTVARPSRSGLFSKPERDALATFMNRR
jgi:biotin synthase-related radical SAM superfamily protein